MPGFATPTDKKSGESLQDEQEKQKLPKISKWTIKSVEAALRLPEADMSKFLGPGTDPYYYVARCVMQEKDPKKIAAKINEINSVEDFVRQATVKDEKLMLSRFVYFLGAWCCTEKGAELFVKDPIGIAKSMAMSLPVLGGPMFADYEIKFTEVQTLKKGLDEYNRDIKEYSRGYGQQPADKQLIEFDSGEWGRIAKALKSATDEQLVYHWMSTSLSFYTKNGQKVYIKKEDIGSSFVLDITRDFSGNLARKQATEK